MDILRRAGKAAAYIRCERIIRAGAVSPDDFLFFSAHATNEQYRRFVRKNAERYNNIDRHAAASAEDYRISDMYLQTDTQREEPYQETRS